MQGRQAEAIALTERALDELRGSRTAYEVAVMAGSTVRPDVRRPRRPTRRSNGPGRRSGSRTRSVPSRATPAPGWPACS